MLLVLCSALIVPAAVADDDSQIVTTRIKYQVQVKDSLESVKQTLISSLEARNYMIINVLNVQEALQTRGITTGKVQLIEFCNLVKAYDVTRTTHEFELFAPCRFALFEDNGTTTVMVLRPSFIETALPKETLSKKGKAVLRAFDRDMRDILTALARGDF
ncbi:MAG: DUF302 domain-containing protein [Sulfuriferula sp.]